MSERTPVSVRTPGLLSERRLQVQAIRTDARVLFDGGATGIQVAAAISEATEAFIRHVFQQVVEQLPPGQQAIVARNVAVVAIGGTGRGELCPFSDVDLLFLVTRTARSLASECISQAVRDYWDAGLRLGHAVRTLGDTLNIARQEIDVATALVEARLIWGDAALCDRLVAEFQKKIVRSRMTAFVDDCVASREKERAEFGSAVKQLEPDVKRSPGGLRDVHLMRWVGFARFGAAGIDSLRLKGALGREEARVLLAAYDFLKRVRVDLHFSAGRCQDVLSRDEQLRITDERGVEGTFGQRPVERFMQTYFRHSTAIAELCERFITLHRPRPLLTGLLRSLATHRSEGIYLVGNDFVDVISRRQQDVVSSLPGILRFYRSAARYGVTPSPEFTERIREAVPRLSGEVTSESAELFRDILGCHGNLGVILRNMFRTGVLEIVVPPMAHARCLLQFNQYHSYTVDEHTLRTIEQLERFDRDPGALGTAYRGIRKKYILHLAMLLHDLGKGYEEDHSLVGRAIADRMADRLRIGDEVRETLVFLVHRHLSMAHLAFRRDTSEPEDILDFSREVGEVPSVCCSRIILRAHGGGRDRSWPGSLDAMEVAAPLQPLRPHALTFDRAGRGSRPRATSGGHQAEGFGNLVRGRRSNARSGVAQRADRSVPLTLSDDHVAGAHRGRSLRARRLPSRRAGRAGSLRRSHADRRVPDRDARTRRGGMLSQGDRCADGAPHGNRFRTDQHDDRRLRV